MDGVDYGQPLDAWFFLGLDQPKRRDGRFIADRDPRKVRIRPGTRAWQAILNVRQDDFAWPRWTEPRERRKRFGATDGESWTFGWQELDVGRFKRRCADGPEAVRLAAVAFGQADERNETHHE